MTLTAALQHGALHVPSDGCFVARVGAGVKGQGRHSSRTNRTRMDTQSSRTTPTAAV